MKIILSDYEESTQKEILEMYDNYQFLKSYDLQNTVMNTNTISYLKITNLKCILIEVILMQL